MENPTFHLEGVIKSREEMQDFEGPLNLILMLLSKNKIEIRDIQISLILEQYLEHIAKIQEIDLEVASEFVQMASHLVYIKTRTLLAAEDEEVSELDLLISSLEQLKCRDAYAGIKAVTGAFSQMSEQGRLLMSKEPEPLRSGFREYGYKHEPVELLKALASIIMRSGQVPEEDDAYSRRIVPKRIVYGVRDKGRELIDLLRRRGEASLAALYAMSKSRSEMVATFVAVLELCSAGNLRISRSDDDFFISLTGDGRDADAILDAFSEEAE